MRTRRHNVTGYTRMEVWMKVKDATKLREARLAAHMSQSRLAAAAGWSSHGYLSRLERGLESTLEVTPALLIAHTLGMSVSELFEDRSTAQHIHQAA